jgi:hypothetical protein
MGSVTSLQLGFDALDQTERRALNRYRVKLLVPIAQELAQRAGPQGITVANLRLEAVRRGILSGEEQGRALSFLGAVMRKAGLTATNDWRRSHISKSHGNAHRVWRAA